MKRFFFLLAGFVLCAAASAQTVKPLAYNLTNGIVMVSTNVTWSNSFKFSTNTVAAQVRTNLGLYATWLTNTNAVNFRNAILAQEVLTSDDGSVGRQWSTGSFVAFGSMGLYAGAGLTNIDDSEQGALGTALLFYTLTNLISANNTLSGTWFVHESDKFRSAIGLGLPALTNSNAANFQSALFSTNTAPTNATNAAVWVTLQVGTNTYRVPCYQ